MKNKIIKTEVKNQYEEFPFPTWNEDYFNHTREEMEHLNLDPNSSILDVGCGTGIFSCALASLGHKVKGVDLSNASIEKAKKNAEEMNLKIDFEQGDLFDYNFGDQKYDVVISGGVLHHNQNAKEGFEIISKLVKPEGRLYVFLYNKTAPTLRFTRWIVKKFGSENKLEFAKRHLKLLLMIHYKTKWKRYLNYDDVTIIDLFCHAHASYHSYWEVKKWYIENGFEFKHLVNLNFRRTYWIEKWNRILRSDVLYFYGKKIRDYFAGEFEGDYEEINLIHSGMRDYMKTQVDLYKKFGDDYFKHRPDLLKKIKGEINEDKQEGKEKDVDQN